MVMVHYANYWGDDVPDTQEKDHFTLALDHGIPVVHTRPITALRSSDQKQLADGQWHHIAVSMPKNSCSVSEVEIYVDGIKVSTTITNDRRIFQTTSGRMSVGGYGYSKVGFEDAYPGSGPYIGKLDDFALFARPLNINVDFPNSIPSISNSPTEFPTVMNDAPCVENSKRRYFSAVKENITVTETCFSLSKKDEVIIERVCQDTSSRESFGPAKDVCQVTCNTCPNACGEATHGKFFLKKKGNKNIHKLCRWLNNDTRRRKWCKVTKSPTKFEAAGVVCPVTCGKC